MRDAVRSRLIVLCHVWPGLTPFNVWDLTWGDWMQFAPAADAWVKAREKETPDV